MNENESLDTVLRVAGRYGGIFMVIEREYVDLTFPSARAATNYRRFLRLGKRARKIALKTRMPHPPASGDPRVTIRVDFTP